MKWPWQLYHWHFEVSGKCMLGCPRCPRNDASPVPWINKELDLGFFQRVLPPEFLQQHVKRITMCGDVGDPIYASQFLEIVDYIKHSDPTVHVFTITNGSYRKPEWWQELARISNQYDTVNFSVDGYDQASNNLYRVRSDWDSIMTGMDIMCRKSTAFVNWATIAFSFNQDHLAHMQQLAKQQGCDGFQLTRSTKFGSKYGSAYGGDSDPLEPRAEYISSTHRYEREFVQLSDRVVPNHEYLAHNLKLFQSVREQHHGFVTPMCQIGNRGLYVGADGVLHPCSWVSFPYQSMSTDRKTIHFKDSFHQRNRDRCNLYQRSLDEVLNDDVWGKLFPTFDDPARAWVECEQKCGRDLVDENYAVGWLTN